MADTPNHGYNVPDQGDEDWHQPLNENFEAYDTDIEIRDQESNLGDYDPKAGAKFLATDTEAMYVGDGNNWNQLATSGTRPTFDALNPSNNFLGVGRDNRIGDEFFGVQATVKEDEYGGMSVNAADPGSLPFYGYATDGSEDARHYYEGKTGKWHLDNGGNKRLTVREDGNVGVGTEDPSSALDVNGSIELFGTLETDDIATNGNPLFIETGSTSVDGIAPAIIMGHPDNAGFTVGGVVAGGGAAGDGNGIGGECPTVSGGRNNTAAGNYSTVSGGRDNEVSGGEFATVSGGENNAASANHATVAGGRDNEASGTHSFAAGRQAKAQADGSFAWSSGTDSSVRALNENEFIAEAAGGFKLFSVSAGATGVELAPGSGSWSSLSTRTAKSNLDPVDGPDVLDRVDELDISTWNYDDQDDDVRHMGPIAEEFHEEFGLGTDEKHISTVDADGVALAAIQGLSERLDEKDERIDDQQDRIDDLKAENKALRERLSAVEDRLDGIETASVASAND